MKTLMHDVKLCVDCANFLGNGTGRAQCIRKRYLKNTMVDPVYGSIKHEFEGPFLPCLEERMNWSDPEACGVNAIHWKAKPAPVTNPTFFQKYPWKKWRNLLLNYFMIPAFILAIWFAVYIVVRSV